MTRSSAATGAILGDDTLLDRNEAAEVLKLSPRTLERYVRFGLGPKITRVGPRRVAYRLSDIREFLAAGTR